MKIPYFAGSEGRCSLCVSSSAARRVGTCTCTSGKSRAGSLRGGRQFLPRSIFLIGERDVRRDSTKRVPESIICPFALYQDVRATDHSLPSRHATGGY